MRIFNSLGKYLFGLQCSSHPIQNNSPVILYTYANVVFSLKNTGRTSLGINLSSAHDITFILSVIEKHCLLVLFKFWKRKNHSVSGDRVVPTP